MVSLLAQDQEMQHTTPARFSMTRRVAATWFLIATAGLLPASDFPASAQELAGGKDRPANRLAKETSPYLLLHAHNPVDWYPWGPEAFARAKAEKKPIFLSIGYSSCYWCHVMERESFMDTEIARFLNEHFVSIKVDREERPDVDQVYMAALQAFSTGGWPMSMFLLPDGRPFYGETYLPPRDRQGISGFLTVLNGIVKAWRDERREIERAADGLTEIVRRKLGGSGNRRKPALSLAFVAAGRAALADQFDPEFGGFGYNAQNPRRPKFPEPVNLVFLLDQERRDRRKNGVGKDRDRAGSTALSPGGAVRPGRADPLSMVLFTLDRMARGGIRDQLGGGYHRYATSRYWIVPHFEKMLYDNAQLASIHLMAFELTGDVRWREEAEATFAFVARTMTAHEGGFYSALDAETASGEGAYYVWSREEVKNVLGAGPDVEVFCQVYGLKRDSNFEGGRYVLLQPRPLTEQANKLETTPEQLQSRLSPLRARMLTAREKRPAPMLDDKIITAWNGLMIAAYADAFRILKNDAYRHAAEKSAEFLLSRLREPGGRLLRTYRAGQAKLPAYLEDYAFLVHGLLRLHAATGESRWLDQARGLTDRMIADFADTQEGGFFFTAGDHESLLARPKDPYDGALPGANSVAVLDLLALSRATGEKRYLEPARKTLESLGTTLSQNPAAMPILLVGLQEYLDARPDHILPGPLGDAAPDPVPNQVVTASARIADAQHPAPGRALNATVSVAIKEGWHIYANPTGVEILKPTTLVLDPGQPAADLHVTYPPGQPKVLGSLGAEKVALYEGKIDIPLRVTLAPDARAGTITVMLKLKYQPCDARVCLAPASLAIPLEVPLGPSPGPVERKP
jgi:uncharacterized protein YyaL (SSP411 family)